MQKAIDVIEGNTRQIIARLHLLFSERGQQDDTEYIRTIRAVVEAAAGYADSLGESSDTTGRLGKALFAFSQQVWLERLLEKRRQEGLSADEEQAAYYSYYYQYIYENNEYPR